MKRTAKQCLYGLVICAWIAGTVRAQDDGSGSARVSDQPGPLPPEATPVFVGEDGPPTGFFPMTPVETWFAPRFYVDSRAGVLYGYEESFTNLGGFVPYFLDDNSMLFADARGLVGYDGRGGASGGVGWRYYMPEYDRYIGLNAWYDFDASHIREYHQAGLGFESVGRYFDLLVNGYIPVGTRQNAISTALLGPGQFVGNGLFLDRYNEVEAAFTGFDANIGGPMPIFGRYGLQGYVGFYFFTAPSDTDFTGVSGRLAWQINEDFNIAVNMTDDHVFGTNTQMQFTMTLPDGRSSRWLRPLSVRDRMMQSVQRNYRVTVEQEIKIVQEAALNPKDGLPYFVVHVDPNAAAAGVNAGNGTVENPYSRLSQFDNLAFADKSAVDIISVGPRIDNMVSNSTNLNTGVTLLSGQRLLSTSVPHSFMAAQDPSQPFTLPGFSFREDGEVVPLPMLTNNTGGNVVTFADGAICLEVSGFEINSGAGASGIVGVNNAAVRINRNVIQGAANELRDIPTATGTIIQQLSLANPAQRLGLNGILLTNLSGLAVDGHESIIEQNIIRNHRMDGINVSNSGTAPLDLIIRNNAPYDIDRDGIAEFDNPNNDPNNPNDPIDPNDVDLNGNGIIDPSEMIADTPLPDSLDGDDDFSNDGILNNGDNGIEINADAGSRINLIIANNGRAAIDANGNLQFDSLTVDSLTVDTPITDTPTIDTDGDGVLDTGDGILDAGDGILDAGDGIPDAFDGEPEPVSSDPTLALSNVLGVRDPITGILRPVEGGIRLNDNNGIELNATASGFIGGQITQNVIGGGAVLTDAAGVPVDAVSFGNGNNGILMTANNGTLDFLNNPIGIRSNVIFGNGAFVPIPPPHLVPSLPPLVNAGSGIRVDAVNSETSLSIMGNVIGSPISAAMVGNPTPPATLFNPRLGNAEYGFNMNQTGGTALLAIGAVNVPADPTATGPGRFGVLNRSAFRFNEIGGININADSNALLAFNIENNEVLNNFQARANGFFTNLGFQYLLDGNALTAPFSLMNNSATGNLVTQFTLNLAPTGTVFDTIEPVQSISFQPQNGTDVLTQLTTVNGTTIIPGTNPLQGSNMVVLPDGGVPDNGQILDLTFNQFDAGEVFSALVDIDRIGLPETGGLLNFNQVDGNDLIGATATVTFFVPSLNLFVPVTGTVTTVPGNLDASQLLIIGGAGLDATPGVGAGQNGISISTAGTTVANQAIIQNNTVSGFGQNGISVATRNASRITDLVVARNRLTFNGVEDDPDTAVSPASSTLQSTGAGLRFERQDSSLLQATVSFNTTVNQTTVPRDGNFGDGMALVAGGTPIGGLFVNSTGNTFAENTGNGVRVFTTGDSILAWISESDVISNNGRDDDSNNNGPDANDVGVLIEDGSFRFYDSNNLRIQSNDDSNVLIRLTNVTATGASSAGLSALATGTSSLTLNVNSALNPLTPSTFSNNGDSVNPVLANGFEFATQDAALGIVTIDETKFESNTGDGLNFDRSGSSLLLVDISNSKVRLNGDDGIQYYATGSDRADPNTPLFNGTTAPANRLLVTNSFIDSNGVIGAANGGNGLEFATLGDAVFISNVLNTRITNSATDGARVFSTGTSSYGEAADRSTFNGVTITGSGRDGIKLFAMGAFDSTPTQFVEVTSTLGITEISNNGDDGIQASVPYGSIDLNVLGNAGPTFTTLIQSNGDNGIEFNVADTAIDGDDAGDSLAANNGERTDGDADGAANEILNFYFPNGFEFTGTSGFNGIGNLNVQNVAIGDDNLNDARNLGNGGDGIEIFVSNVWNFVGGGDDGIGGTPTFGGGNGADAMGNPLVGANAANDHDVNRDNVIDGAFGAGNISRNFITNQAGQMTVTINESSLDGNGQDGLNIVSDGNNGTFEVGNLIFTSVTNNSISSNGRHGVNIDLEGVHGGFATTFGPGGTYTVVLANQFNFSNNVIQRNNNYGFRYQANAGVIRRVNFGLAADTYFWSEQFQDGVQPATPTPFAFDPQFICDNNILSSIFNTQTQNNASGLTSDYYSIATDLNSRLVFTNNTVQFNGQSNQGFNEGGDGMFIRVSTNSYLSADIGGAAGSGMGNTFTGNALADLRFESFAATWVDGLSAPIPNVSTAGAMATLDQLFLDDTAQLTLRFNNNIGRELNADALATLGATAGLRTAAYGLNGSPFIGNTNGFRRTQIFQVDDGNNLDVTNTFGTNLANEFQGSGGWYLVPVADPLFPNPTFPENCFEDFGDPFFP